MGILDRALNVGESKQFRQYEKRVALINAFEPELELESDEELRERFGALRERATGGEDLEDLLPETFAIVREMGKRTMGMRHFDVQLIGGQVQHGGRISPDGKTVASHNFAIVDEVDNILIDEARTPLIISGAPEQAADFYAKFARLAPTMEPGKSPEGMDPKSKKDFVADFDY